MAQSKLTEIEMAPLGRDLGDFGEPHATGGSAEVYRTRLDGHEVAVKVGLGDGAADVCVTEAEVLALALSPRMPMLRAVGWLRREKQRFVVAERSRQARPFIILDWCAQQAHRSSPTAQALTIARDVGEALADAHAVGIAHGDVKVENIVVGTDGNGTLLDWGLACSVFAREPKGGTLRYLPTDDSDLGDARARDVLALGVLLAECCDPSIRAATKPIAAARAATLPAPFDAICDALLAPSPNARPDARWVSEMSLDSIGRGSGSPSDSWPRQVRASYLRTRRGALLGVAADDAAPWLATASRWMRAIDALRSDAEGSLASEILPLLDLDGVNRWLVQLVGPQASSWPLGRIADAGERRIAEGLLTLASRLPPRAFTLLEVEQAVLGPFRPPGRARPTPTGVERIARLSMELSTIPPSMSAVATVEYDVSLPPTLVIQAANALRIVGELGRARSLALRATEASVEGSGGLFAEVLRRSGDLEGAAERATRALDDDVDERSRAVLGRLAFDRGDAEGALAQVDGEAGAPCAEVAALAFARLGEVRKALSSLERGEAYARSAEDRARLAGTRGYILANVTPAAALTAYRTAVDHAVRAGIVVEEATYRTGEAATAVDEGYLGEALATGARAALLWESLGRPALAARAVLAMAAAHATLGLSAEATRSGMRAVRLAREGGDSRAEAYGFLAIADGGGARPGDSGAAAASARSIVDSMADDTDDRLRVMARIADHGRLRATDDLGAIDALAEKASASPSARMDWWGARARQLLRVDGASRAETGTPTLSRHDVVLAALVALSTTPMAVSARGPALHAGARLAVACGRSDVAERLRPALRDAARTLISRVGPDLAGRAAEIDWVTSNLVTDEISMDAEQVRDLEHLVRSLGTGERLGPLLRRVLDALVLWTGVERGLLLLKAPDGRLVPRAARNFARDDLRGEQATLSQSLAHRAIEALEPVVAVDAAGELPHVHRSVHALRLRSVLAVPLVARGEALGVAYLDDRIRRGAFGPRELAWARTIAALASSMIADARDQVLLRRAVRAARRSNERLTETLADREAKLDAAERTLERSASTRGTRHRYEEIVGESEPMSRLLRTLDRVAASDVPVLVVGESGSGKELIARAIHSSGARAKKPFVSENCGAIPEGLLESALFGHVRGAFTGADRPRVGLFEAADGGTLFLDEVGEMSLGMQTKLLRVLEDGLVRPLGTEKPRKVDVRVITATHRDLEAMVRERTFREDLFYRLNIIAMRVPPLRERASDIPLLVKRLIDKHAGGRTISVSRAAMQRLSTFGWPGNVRQLENEIRRALVLADEVIDREHISPEIDGGLNGPVAEAGLNVRKRVDLLEGMLVRDALERTRGNQTQAAKLLGLSRFGLQKMMKRLDVTLP